MVTAKLVEFRCARLLRVMLLVVVEVEFVVVLVVPVVVPVLLRFAFDG
jgi:hypothetical protein